MSITSYRLKILAKIESLSEETGLTSPKEVAEEMEVKPENLRVAVHRLKKIGWVEAPYIGCLRLTTEGKNLLHKMRFERDKQTVGGI